MHYLIYIFNFPSSTSWGRWVYPSQLPSAPPASTHSPLTTGASCLHPAPRAALALTPVLSCSLLPWHAVYMGAGILCLWFTCSWTPFGFRHHNWLAKGQAAHSKAQISLDRDGVWPTRGILQGAACMQRLARKWVTVRTVRTQEGWRPISTWNSP